MTETSSLRVLSFGSVVYGCQPWFLSLLVLLGEWWDIRSSNTFMAKAKRTAVRIHTCAPTFICRTRGNDGSHPFGRGVSWRGHRLVCVRRAENVMTTLQRLDEVLPNLYLIRCQRCCLSRGWPRFLGPAANCRLLRVALVSLVVFFKNWLWFLGYQSSCSSSCFESETFY